MRRLIVVFLMGGLGAACASSGPPVEPQLVTDVEVAIRNAENAGAPERAPDLLAKSRSALDAARKASAAGDGNAARARLTEANAYAEAAAAKAKAEKAKSDAAQMRRDADELEAKTRQIRP
jgi:hypothetical protein